MTGSGDNGHGNYPEDRARRLMREHYPKVLRWLNAQGISAADAHDVAAQAVYELVKASGMQRIENDRAFLFKIAKRRQWDMFRKRSRNPDLVEYETTKVTQRQLGTRLSTVVSRRATITNVMADKLPLPQQHAVLLKWGEGMTSAEVAEALEVSKATADRYLSAAKATLEPELASLLRKGEDVAGAVKDAYDGEDEE